MRRGAATLVAVLSSLIVALPLLGATPQQERPPFPVIYGGSVFVKGAPAPAGLSVVGCVIDCSRYKSDPVLTDETGRYRTLVVGPPNEAFLNEEITFWIENQFGAIQAAETATFDPTIVSLTRTLTLRFGEEVPTPPPSAPMPTPTVTATPTATPVLPIPGDSSVRSLPRMALIVGVAALLAGGMILLLFRRRRAL